jgi:peptidoglycan/LPS O-acetylase OafA/YrhL
MSRLAELFELSKDRRNLPMEGLRGFAVFLVFMVHYTTLCEPWTGAALRPIGGALRQMGNIGVDLFFVLSGYLIYGSLIAKEQRFGKFMLRRAQRIYPAFLAVFAVYLALSLVFPRESKIPADGALTYIVQNLLLLPGIFPIEPIITVAWSLSYEMFFYLTIPLLIALLLLRRWTPVQRCVLFVLFAAAISLVDHRRFLMFIGGILICELMKIVRPPPAAVAVGGILVALASPFPQVPTQLRIALLMIGCCALCWHCFAAQSFVSRAFSWTPLRWLGNMSYSYYLIHGLALKFAFMIFGLLVAPGKDLFVALLAPMFAVTLVPSALLFLLIERPFSLQTKSPARVVARAVAE